MSFPNEPADGGRLDRTLHDCAFMWPPSARNVLIAAGAVAVLLSAALADVLFGRSTLAAPADPAPWWVILVPALAAVMVVQAIRYPSVGRRLGASAVVAAASLGIALLVLVLLGCGHYDACA